jgi:hypothetical protein
MLMTMPRCPPRSGPIDAARQRSQPRSLAGLAALLALAFSLCRPQLTAAQAAAGEPAPQTQHGIPPTAFWLCGSASLLSATLGTYFATRALNDYHRAEALPGVSPERREFVPLTRHAELTADLLFAGAALLAISGVVLALHTDWSASQLEPHPDLARARVRRPQLRLMPSASSHGASLWLRGEWL